MREILSKTHLDGTTIKYFMSDDRRTITSEVSYTKNYKSLHEQIETENETLPKTKRRYMTEEGKVVGYLTAKKLGIIS
jgi:hypothetical protein